MAHPNPRKLPLVDRATAFVAKPWAQTMGLDHQEVQQLLALVAGIVAASNLLDYVTQPPPDHEWRVVHPDPERLVCDTHTLVEAALRDLGAKPDG